MLETIEFNLVRKFDILVEIFHHNVEWCLVDECADNFALACFGLLLCFLDSRFGGDIPVDRLLFIHTLYVTAIRIYYTVCVYMQAAYEYICGYL